MIHPALAGLQAALDADPLDTAARCALADWWEEQGDDEAAACMRWLARAQVSPKHDVYGAWDDWGWTTDTNLWIRKRGGSERVRKRAREYARAALPGRLFQALSGGHPSGPAWRYFPTRQAAEDALLAAWRALPPSKRPA